MFNEFLTTEGERLLAKSIAGTATITFTKMELGDGDRGTASKNITSLESKQMTLDIYSVQLSGDNHITITSMLKSENIESGFYFREKAVYATDGTTEILFMYGTAGSLAEWIQNSLTSVFERTIRTIIVLSDGDAVNVTIQDGVYASGEAMEQTKTEILTAISNIKLDGDWAKYEQAESILSLLDNFVAAYTTLRAGKLDNLDALVSSRAPASTALSNGVWTNGRAAAIDNLDAKISSRAPASTALSNAVWTNARAGYLDLLVNGSYGLNAINNKVKKGMTLSKYYSNKMTYTAAGETAVFAINGSGVLEGVLVVHYASANNTARLRIVIDGVEIFNQTSSNSDRSTLGIVRADMISTNRSTGLHYAYLYPYNMVATTTPSHGVCSNGILVPSNNYSPIIIPEPIHFDSSIGIYVYSSIEISANPIDVAYGVIMD